MCVYCCEIVRSYLLDITALLELETQAFRYTSDNICKTCVCDQYNLILGQVFDVEKGMKHYGPSGGNNFFTGGVPVRLADLLSQGLQAYGQTGGGSSTVKVESPERPCCRWRQPWRRGRHSRTKPRLSNTSQPATQSGVLLGEDGSGAPPRVVERREARPAYLGYCSLLARAALAVCVQNSSTVKNPNIQDYEGCPPPPPHAESCSVRE